MEILWHDLRFAARTLLKKPGFTFVLVLALALGIGANTAIFSVVNAVLLRPLPYKDAGQLVWIWGTNPRNDIDFEVASAPDYNDWKTQSQSFEEMGAFVNTRLTLTDHGEPERYDGAYVTEGFFEVLGVQPQIGRTFTEDENKPNSARVIVLSHALWQRRFGGDPKIVDQAITINGNPYTVVGVMPAEFMHPRPESNRKAEMWVPLQVDYAKAGRRGD